MKKNIHIFNLFLKKYKTYILYILSGLISLLFEMISFNLFILYFNYKISNLFSITFGITINYILSITFVFNNRNTNNNKFEFLKFVIFSTVRIWINQISLIFYYENFNYNIQYTKLLSILTSTIFNFLSKKYLVFNKQ